MQAYWGAVWSVAAHGLTLLPVPNCLESRACCDIMLDWLNHATVLDMVQSLQARQWRLQRAHPFHTRKIHVWTTTENWLWVKFDKLMFRQNSPDVPERFSILTKAGTPIVTYLDDSFGVCMLSSCIVYTSPPSRWRAILGASICLAYFTCFLQETRFCLFGKFLWRLTCSYRVTT